MIKYSEVNQLSGPGVGKVFVQRATLKKIEAHNLTLSSSYLKFF